ncbi:MAG: AMP-binding protein [Planctomycetaceae bacterium]|nr:AMP-binding protein [Planctomycetaceae bacterium]
MSMRTPSASAIQLSKNIGQQLSVVAADRPHQIAVAAPNKRINQGRRCYDELTFQQLDDDSDRIAGGLQSLGLQPRQRIVLMVRPGLDFISLTFALFKAAATVVLIDPGMGRNHLIQCLSDARPDGFVGISMAQAARILYRHRFPTARINVTVGRRWGWGGPTLKKLRLHSAETFQPPAVEADDPAAIIFTTGSTGPPKGVLYRHGNFSQQVAQLRDTYEIQPGEIDLPGFPLFALFNSAMGVTTVIPDMDPTRPADVNPANIIEPIQDWKITQAFGSPALWNAVGKHCEANDIQLPTLRRVLSAGAPVPHHVLQKIKNAIAMDGDIHTPYGATEALPVATIAGTEVLESTAKQTALGAGTCVGRRFSQIKWKVIRIHDDPIESIDQVEEVPQGEIGELIVQGPVVTTEYVTRTESNPLAKIKDQTIWHRMGDVGYLDELDRFWFCGRKAHRLVTERGTMFTIRCEAIFNQHPTIYRSALVGVGQAPQQIPVLIAEPWPGQLPSEASDQKQLRKELYKLGQANELTSDIQLDHILLRATLPVDIRHNAKIFREQLAVWATQELGG